MTPQTNIKRLLLALTMLIPIVVLAGVDQPWNEPYDGGGSITLGSTIAAIAYFGLLFLWPKQLFLFAGAFIVGGAIDRWFGDPFGWLVGIALFIWGYKEFIHEGPKPPTQAP